MKKLLVLVFSLILIACGSDYSIVQLEPGIIYVDREVEVIVEVEVEVEVEVPIDGPQGDVWVERFYQPDTSSGTDILWVIDFSGSMNSDNARLLAGIEAMMNALPPYGWRLMMISATPINAATEPFQFPLVPGDGIDEALGMYNSIMQGQWECGRESAYEYIENNPAAGEWMRDDATLLTVFVSDEFDQSAIPLNEWISWYEGLRSEGSTFAAAITNLNDNFGYAQVVDHFNGIMIDIMDNNWSLGVAEATVQLEPYESWILEFVPFSDTVIVFVDGLEFLDWYYDQATNTIFFDVLPNSGTLVELGYIIKF
jgi:hypothetical protein